jgi:hypothetical protein
MHSYDAVKIMGTGPGVPETGVITKMSLIVRIGLTVMLAGCLAIPALARDEPPAAAVQRLVAFSSDEGMARLARSTAKADFAALANQYEAQSNSIFCGPTTAAIVLNALRERSSALPRDRSRLQAGDQRYIPGTFDPIIPRYTQDNVLAKGPKTRAQVLGEPMTRNGQKVQDFGMQLRQLDALFKANGVHTRLVVVDHNRPESAIRTDLVENLKHRGDYVIVNYTRKAVGQNGGGHISPLAAYDRESDSFLVLDVNPAASGWVWMPTATLIRGMRTFDTVENRGYILLAP